MKAWKGTHPARRWRAIGAVVVAILVASACGSTAHRDAGGAAFSLEDAVAEEHLFSEDELGNEDEHRIEAATAPGEHQTGPRSPALPSPAAVSNGTTGTDGQADGHTKGDDSADCQQHSVTVNPPVGGQQMVSGTLCLPSGPPPSAVQVLNAGGTYSRVYWDYSHQAPRYSYVRHALDAGYATFAFDRVGSGASSYPPSALLTVPSQADALHQIIQQLRQGNVGGVAFERVVTVSHSLGSAIAVTEAGTYKDVDGVIVTGFLHGFAADAPGKMALAFYPAMLDPKFAGEVTDPGYVTTRPGTRNSSLVHSEGTDPALAAIDEQTKDTMSENELATGSLVFVNGIASQIEAPVLLVVGSKDQVVCGFPAADCSTPGSVIAHEEQHYGSASCLEAWVLPNSGHDLNLDPNAPDFFAAANTWTDRMVGPDGDGDRCPGKGNTGERKPRPLRLPLSAAGADPTPVAMPRQRRRRAD